MKTEKQARIAGEKLLKRMKGKGWLLRVWENLGWHYSVHLFNLTLSEHLYRSKKSYSALLITNESFAGSGEVFWSDKESFDDPNEAVTHQMQVSSRVYKCLS